MKVGIWIFGLAMALALMGCESESGGEETGQEETGQEETGQEETGQEETGQEETGEEAEATLSNINETIFVPRCVACHTEMAVSAGGAGGLVLEGAGIHEALVDVQSEWAPLLDRVTPGDPDNSFLMVKILGLQGFGEGDAMPPLGGLLGDDEVDLIRQWILDGAENN